MRRTTSDKSDPFLMPNLKFGEAKWFWNYITPFRDYSVPSPLGKDKKIKSAYEPKWPIRPESVVLSD